MNIDEFVTDLLRIDDGIKNKLIDLNAGDPAGVFYLSHSLQENPSAYLLDVIQKRTGKLGNTVMRGSAPAKEQFLGLDSNDVEWRDGSGERDPVRLDKFIRSAYGEINAKGINPVFLGVGAIRWQAPLGNAVREILSPLLVFPVRLVRSVKTNPVVIEFIADDVYLNPCFTAKLGKVWGEEVRAGFPHPNGAEAEKDEPVDLAKLGDGQAYFKAVEEYTRRCREGDRANSTVFRLERDVLAISRFNHDEICMYYDVRRNRDKIDSHPLIRRIFEKCPPVKAEKNRAVEPWFVLPRDSVQEEMIRSVVNGESLIIKGPPGTGKTLTIANMIAALLSEGKKVLLASEKLSALSEVYAKLPEKLRPFAMLLDCETSAQAAKLNPTDVRRDFAELLRARSGYAPVGADVYAELDRARRETADAVREISAHIAFNYLEPVAGGSYYDGIDAFCKNDLPTIAFAEGKDVAALSKDDYNVLLGAVERAGEYFDSITDGGKHSVAQCPWYPRYGTLEGKNTEGAFLRLRALASAAEKVISGGEELLAPLEVNKRGIRVYELYRTAKCAFKKEELETLCALPQEKISALEESLAEYLKCDRTAAKQYGLAPSEDAAELAARLAECRTEEKFTGNQLKTLYEKRDLLARMDGGEKHILTELANCFHEFLDRAAKHGDNAMKTFSSDLTEEELALAEGYFSRLAPYVGDEKPGTFDFGAKKAYKKLRPLSYLNDVSFAEIVNAVVELHEKRECVAEAEEIVSKLNRMFRRELGKEELEAVMLYGRISAGENFLAALGEEHEFIAECALRANRKRGDYTLAELKAVYRVCAAEYALRLAVSATGLPANSAEDAENICAAYRFSKTPALLGDPVRVMLACECAKEEFLSAAGGLLRDLDLFGKGFFESYYTETHGVTFGDLCVFAREADDRNVAGAAAGFFTVTRDPKNKLSLDRFFRPFETGMKKKGNASYAEWFEHSYYALALAYRQAQLGEGRNGAGRRISRALDNWTGAEETASRAAVSIIANKCMARIAPNDPDYAFLEAERGGTETLRKLFKRHGGAILKLKRCFLLSPSTVSVLFGAEEYSDFDVVIVDEASQLEPTAILPVLFRAKQCVLVGDEWQMPPMKHFVAQSEKRISDAGGEEIVLEPEISVLSLALRNEAFPVRRLDCHYRSKTEALIAFSQKRYYDGMRTFPAPVPIAEGLGFEDIFVKDGVCKNAVNAAEAEEVVKRIERHFERYYEEETGVLQQSFGVVAFGQEQTEYILSRVRANKALQAKIDRALSTFKDVKEKLIFFKTIETVQGQETQHLILSLTYGRREDGKIVQSFGEMNRGRLGQCIFNVAVTRAQSSVTVVHSVAAEDITNENVSYLRDYLTFVRTFSGYGRGQFVSSPPAKGFLRSVGEFIVSQGIDEKRVVYNYGVTKDSVRIPVAVLSQDLCKAQLGVWCETPPARTGGENYFDANARRYASLVERGWKLVRVYAHDWIDNAGAEREALAAAVEKYVKKPEEK